LHTVLEDFIRTNRGEIIASARARIAARIFPKASDAELTNGVPVFLDQLGDALHLAKSSEEIDHAEMGRSAALHGSDLLRMGLTVGQVVHDYGDICQAITELAVQRDLLISGDEFQTLNLCLDDAIADAVTSYSARREQVIEDRGTERLGMLSHELRNLTNTAILAFDGIKSGRVPAGGSTGLVLSRSLMGLVELIDRSLAEVRLDAGIERLQRVPLAGLVEAVEISALIQAQPNAITFSLMSDDRTGTIEADQAILTAAISNLLQNAFKFTPRHGNVSLTVRRTEQRILFEIEDECGGLPPGKIEDLFRPFAQRGADRSGVGLGLAICAKAAEIHGGELRARDLPGKGCVFTLDLPRKPPPLSARATEEGAAGPRPPR
jgi:signal transduction histidine kinase